MKLSTTAWPYPRIAAAVLVLSWRAFARNLIARCLSVVSAEQRDNRRGDFVREVTLIKVMKT
jgi:hypothetical protein